jgi:hypothetical protein
MSDATFWEAPSTNIPVVNADGNIFEETQVAVGGETVFTLATFTYTPNTKSIFIWKNGSLLRRNVDYTETSSTQVTMAVAAVLNDKYTFIAFAIQQIIPPIVFNGQPAGGTVGQVLVKQSGSDYDSDWEDPDVATTLLDAARVNVASASTVDLTAVAATTRNIQITGTIQIDGFQVTNGQVWVVKFASSLTLKNNANIVTQAGQDIKVSPNDTCLLRATADNVVEVLNFVRGTGSLTINHHNFRLTLTTGLPVTTADVVAASTLYCTPYRGNKISLFNGTTWVTRESAEFSIVLAGLTANRPYDVFCYDNVGVPTLELTAWASATARATALATQDGVYIKAGDATRKYLGSFHALSATTTTDSLRQRLVWNYYNRVGRKLLRQETAANWNYSTNVIRQANANVLNQLEYMCGMQEDDVEFRLAQTVQHSVANLGCRLHIGLDSTVAAAAGSSNIDGISMIAAAVATSQAFLSQYAQLGFHYYTWLEIQPNNTVTATWYGMTNSYFTGAVFA